MDLDERLRRVQLIVCDVDGVLTDGSIPYDGEGKPFRTVHVRDVTAFTLWHLGGGKTAVVSGLGSAAVEAIARQWRIAECHTFIRDKRRVCGEIAERHGLPMEALAFLGDDFIDVWAMQAVGLAVAVSDAMPEAKEAAHLVMEARGGQGPLRELVQRILVAQGRFEEVLQAYCARQDGPQ